MLVLTMSSYGHLRFRKMFETVFNNGEKASKQDFIKLCRLANNLLNSKKYQKEVATSMCGFFQYKYVSGDLLLAHLVSMYCSLELPDKHIKNKDKEIEDLKKYLDIAETII